MSLIGDCTSLSVNHREYFLQFKWASFALLYKNRTKGSEDDFIFYPYEQAGQLQGCISPRLYPPRLYRGHQK